MSSVKKWFFNIVFCLMYVSFAAQLIYVVGWVNGLDAKLIALGMLSIEWLAIIGARYLSKRSANSSMGGGRSYGGNFRR